MYSLGQAWGKRSEGERQKHNERLGDGERPRPRRTLGEGSPIPAILAPYLFLPSVPTPPHPSPSHPLSRPTEPLSGAPEGLCPGHAGPPWGLWEFLHSALPMGTLGGGALESGLRALGPCPALEAEEGSLTVAKGKGYF